MVILFGMKNAYLEKQFKCVCSSVFLPQLLQICLNSFLHSEHCEYVISSLPQILQLISGILIMFQAAFFDFNYTQIVIVISIQI